jgi:4-diphosphocytidyl-2-C-methyl-D-erythritol kinase
MISFPGAKINLGLWVTEKRSDGFHNLESIFYPIRWTDAVELIPSTATSINLSGLVIPGPVESNLMFKAWKKLNDRYQVGPVEMHLHKVVPMGAGLGGGSANAAAVINLINEVFSLNLSIAERETIAAELGSDCAFFIDPKASFASAKGDLLNPIELDLSAYSIAVVHPGVSSNTAEAYQRIKPKQAEFDLRELNKLPIKLWQDKILNDFEPGIFNRYPQVQRLKEHLSERGALYTSMSGSGSAVFGLFDFSITEAFLDLPSDYAYFIQNA